MTDDLKNDVEFADPDIQDRIQGKNLFHAPQPAITTPSTANGGVLSSSAGGDALSMSDSAILTTLLTRVSDLETALVKLGLIKHR